ncbi:hypothetical protein J2Y00_002719 [Deinococcus soli (ex Cha et al. 2016)]|uniref:Uncharacterized protein n=2 Tax=Deinococcus soli (ex Cha et al. 2016) TaxID=1309411 RepID=A0AAE3XEN2_9DEIO|nr:hypothetical protein [Deinococcus soli (ex Cha et al. 2016)]MDR6329371.1 hypothetical protein [Deinococcus soli (ex Cha et al. 2016)]MDR6752031.1 hypothetical protein [Deinococcus soli (ex Cha et al. 2016)]
MTPAAPPSPTPPPARPAPQRPATRIRCQLP